MQEITKQQIAEWAEELKRQITAKEQAQKDLEQANININALQGGIQFGELVLKKSLQANQPSDITESGQQSKTKSSK